jgi:hypothetical protein
MAPEDARRAPFSKGRADHKHNQRAYFHLAM